MLLFTHSHTKFLPMVHMTVQFLGHETNAPCIIQSFQFELGEETFTKVEALPVQAWPTQQNVTSQ